MEKTSNRWKIVSLFMLFLLLAFVSAFRDGLGTDYVNYISAFESPEEWNQEFLFKWIFLIIPNLITSNELIFFILTSLVINYYFIKSINTYSSIVILSVIIYITQLYFSSYNVVRQFVALAIFSYYGAKYINEKRLVAYFILVLILSQIHYSMYILLLFPIIGYYSRSVKVYWYIWSISFVLFILQNYEIINIASIFNLLPNLGFVSDKFAILESSADYFFGQFQSSNQLIFKNILCIAFLVRLKYLKDGDAAFWINLFLFGTVLHNVLVKFSMMAVRLAYLGDLAMVMLVPFYINTFKSKKIRISLIVIFSIYVILLFYYRFVLNGESEVFKQGMVIEE
jgi:hypothetical protein